jgi:nitrogen regulatory protein PII
MNSGIRIRVLRSEADIQTVREAWTSWQHHPNADLDFFLMIVSIRPEVIGPYVLALYRDDVLETLLVGRLEHDHLPLNIGYWHLFRFPVRNLTFIYGGLMGNASDENCAALIGEVRQCLKRENVHLATLHFVAPDSAICRSACSEFHLLRRDCFPETRPHWLMRLPTDIEEVHMRESPKTRQTRRYKANKLAKDYRNDVRVECYTGEADLERVLEDAESVARRTYQRGLGVGFVANHENLVRFRAEAKRGRFHGYFLYVGGKPVAFFLGTLYKNVLHDNFTAYDPDFSKYSPGTFLFFQIFERLCRDGVGYVDFGFGDAWYKAHFGNKRLDEATISVFAPTMSGIGLNLIRIPVAVLDRLGKRAVGSLSVLRSIKKRWRERAQKQAAAAA